MFWFKRKKIVLDCITSNPFVYEYAKISKAVKCYPDWWLNLPKINADDDIGKVNMKYCKGFTDLYLNSIIIPFWGNLVVQPSKDKKMFKWNSDFNIPKIKGGENIEVHTQELYEGFIDDRFQHFKLMSPWCIKANKNTKFLLHDSMWNRRDLSEYFMLPGVVDFKYQNGCNINLMFEYKDTNKNISFTPAHPVAMLTPLSEEDVEIKNHLVSDQEFERHNSLSKIFFSMFNNPIKKYNTNKSFIDKHHKRSEPKCPFGFGK